MKIIIAFLLGILLVGCQPPTTVIVPDNASARDIIALTNVERTKHNLKVVKVADKLAKAAQDYAELMRSTGKLSHTINGLTLQKRLDAVDYNWRYVGENIAFGYTSAQGVVDGWMNSPGHRANILNPNFREIGVGISGRYNCQIFGMSNVDIGTGSD